MKWSISTINLCGIFFIAVLLFLSKSGSCQNGKLIFHHQKLNRGKIKDYFNTPDAYFLIQNQSLRSAGQRIRFDLVGYVYVDTTKISDTIQFRRTGNSKDTIQTNRNVNTSIYMIKMTTLKQMFSSGIGSLYFIPQLYEDTIRGSNNNILEIRKEHIKYLVLPEGADMVNLEVYNFAPNNRPPKSISLNPSPPRNLSKQ